MRFQSYILFSIFLIFSTSCSKEESNNNQFVNSGLVGTWNATNTSGGFAGISCVYQPGELVLTFDLDGNLTITNNVLNTTAICGGQELGVEVGDHKFGVLESNDKTYLLVNDIEHGEIEVASNEFILNQNSSSVGFGADLYFLTFAKQ